VTVQFIALKKHYLCLFFTSILLENADLQTFVKQGDEMLVYLCMAAVSSTAGQSPVLLTTI